MQIRIEDDFDLRRIADSGQCFRWTMQEDGSCRILHAGKCLYIKPLGGDSWDFDCTQDEFDEIWHGYLDLDLNYRSIRSMIDRDKDPFLFAASEHEKGIRILRQDPWETLISFIISQNRNIPAIKNSIELISSMAGEKKTDSRGREYFSFPVPESLAKLTEDDLTSCRLGYRTRYIKLTAQAVADGSFDLDALTAPGADDDEILEKLTSLCGVGKKVANCMLLFGLHHLDAFPIDVWIKRILENEYAGGYPYEDYRPYNGIFQQYMFAYYRNPQ